MGKDDQRKNSQAYVVQEGYVGSVDRIISLQYFGNFIIRKRLIS